MNLSVIIPFYNEIDNVQKINDELMPVVSGLSASFSIEIVFVDDGSRDGTMDSLKHLFDPFANSEISIKYATNNGNWGLGQALRTGFAECTGDIIITTDFDGTYKFDSFKDLLLCLNSGIDIVTASPYHPDGKVIGVPAYRLILSKGSSIIYRILVNRKIHTYTCLFRAYRRDVIENIPFVSNGFLAGTELLVKSMLSGYKVGEYPADLYRRTFGTSKARLVRTILAHLRFQFNIVLHRLRIISLTDNDKVGKSQLWIKTKYSVVPRN